MTKVTAYRCDCCLAIKEEKRIVGVSQQEDLFEVMRSYPFDMKHPEKFSVHCCLDCYSSHATEPAQRETNRRKDEEGYRRKLHELSYNLRKQCVMSYLRLSHKKNLDD